MFIWMLSLNIKNIYHILCMISEQNKSIQVFDTLCVSIMFILKRDIHIILFFLLYFDYNIECFNYNIYDIYKDTSHTIIV